MPAKCLEKGERAAIYTDCNSTIQHIAKLVKTWTLCLQIIRFQSNGTQWIYGSFHLALRTEHPNKTQKKHRSVKSICNRCCTGTHWSTILFHELYYGTFTEHTKSDHEKIANTSQYFLSSHSEGRLLTV